MKIKFNTNQVVYTIVGLYIAIVSVSSFIVNYQYGPESDTYVADNLKPIDGPIPDSLIAANYKYNKLKDSIKTLRGYKNGDIGGSGWSVGFIGTTSNQSCDTCSLKWYAWQSYKDGTHQHYYIKLPYWRIRNSTGIFSYSDSVKFHVEHEQGYLRKVVPTHEMKDKKGSYYNGYLVDDPVKFRYDTRDQSLLIPVSKSVKNTMDVVLGIVGICMASYFGFLILIFLVFILNVSKGLVFTDGSIFILKLIAMSLLIYPVAAFLLNLLLKLIFHSYFTPDVIMSPDVWKGQWKTIGLGLVFLVLYRAFRQGKILKEEQELTV